MVWSYLDQNQDDKKGQQDLNCLFKEVKKMLQRKIQWVMSVRYKFLLGAYRRHERLFFKRLHTLKLPWTVTLKLIAITLQSLKNLKKIDACGKIQTLTSTRTRRRCREFELVTRKGMTQYLQHVKITGVLSQKIILHWCLPKHSASIWHQTESLLINMYRITFLAHFFKITGCTVAAFQILLPPEPDSLLNALSK